MVIVVINAIGLCKMGPKGPIAISGKEGTKRVRKSEKSVF